MTICHGSLSLGDRTLTPPASGTVRYNPALAVPRRITRMGSSCHVRRHIGYSLCLLAPDRERGMISRLASQKVFQLSSPGNTNRVTPGDPSYAPLPEYLTRAAEKSSSHRHGVLAVAALASAGCISSSFLKKTKSHALLLVGSQGNDCYAKSLPAGDNHGPRRASNVRSQLKTTRLSQFACTEHPC